MRSMMSEASDDWGLVARAKSGSSGAFGQLYERHRARVYHTALRILRQRGDAEDVVQRCFQRAFTNLAGFRAARPEIGEPGDVLLGRQRSCLMEVNFCLFHCRSPS
jgi:hypothetical protein